MTLRATATAGNNGATIVNTLPITVPTSGVGGTVVAGDVAIIFLNAVSTVAATPVTPSGWTIVSAEILIGTTSLDAIVYGKVLTSGDIGSAVTLSWTGGSSGNVRPVAAMVVESAVNFATRQVPTPVTNNTGSGQVTNPTLPVQASVASGSTVLCAFSRRNATGGATTVSVPAGYTEVVEAISLFGNPAEASVTVGRKAAPALDSYGGESGTTNPTTAGVNYLVVLPSTGGGNIAPTANAGTDQINVEPGAVVTIGGVDTDPDGTIATIAWTQIAGTTKALSSTTVASPTLVAPLTTAGTTLTYRKVVTDNNGTASAPDDVSITVLPVSERIAIGGVWVPARWRVL